MHQLPDARRLKGCLAPLIALLLLWLTPAHANDTLNDTLNTADAWALNWLETAVPRLLTLSANCDQPAAARFFETNGGNYRLSLGAGTAEIIGRGSWGALAPITTGRSWQAYPATSSVCTWIRRITVHHTEGQYTIQSLQRFHQNIADPKADIAYHFFIDSDGLIYEARPLGYMGSHSEGDNGSNLGIVLNGNFMVKPPDPRQLAALRTLLQALRCPCAPAEGVWTHQQRKALRFPDDPAHYTDCPGQQLAIEVKSLATELGFGPITTGP